ncbi:MAG TPA: ferritin-like fold-containing protein [Candidatus Lustribacter sp.]|nr:ferritin-like fold-containing protein [Candidatus Lustribacter sp.]
MDEPSDLTAPAADGSAPATPGLEDAVVDLLGALGYGELMAFSQLAADAEIAPDQSSKVALARLAVAEFHHFELILARITELGGDPDTVMAPFVHSFDDFHARTRPSGWLEGLVKFYVGDGIASDFYSEIAAYVDPVTRELIHTVMEGKGQDDVIVAMVRQAISDDTKLAGRLALWGRRLVGEALTQAQRVVVERESVAGLLVGSFGGAGADLAELGRMFARLTDEHTRRMARLGLSA